MRKPTLEEVLELVEGVVTVRIDEYMKLVGIRARLRECMSEKALAKEVQNIWVCDEGLMIDMEVSPL